MERTEISGTQEPRHMDTPVTPRLLDQVRDKI
jgi:hypothetical protein